MYLFDHGVAPYASYSTSFQPLLGVDAYDTPYQPLRSKQFELGVKYQPEFMDATVSVALFDLRQDNSLTASPDPAATGSVQLGQTRSQGVELEAAAQLTENLRLLGAYSYQDVEIIAGSAIDTTIGKMPTARPRRLASLWLDYTFKEGPLQGLGVGSGMQHVGATYANAANTLTVDPFTVVDASIHYDMPNWRFTLSANNLLDETYVARCGNVTRCQYGQRRNVLFTVRYSW